MMDSINRKIVQVLQENGRISFAQLADEVHLSAPAAAERVKKLEQAGIISGYHASVDLEHLGYSIVCYVLANVFTGKENEFIKLSNTSEAVIECYNVTGEQAFILKVAVKSMSELDDLLEDYSSLSQTSTKVVLSTQVKNRILNSTIDQKQ